ncbi:MAG TPA: hypothetical protein VFO70_00305 [Chitinophagaceae bacterium]|nr:hypothetical protein [Chitinophagaceae bacterium]
MQSEEIDKKIREAAEHHYPAYNEEAWGKMEKLLDKHMPQEKDEKRRRVIFFLLLFLLLGGGTWFFIASPWKSGSTQSAQEQRLQETQTGNVGVTPNEKDSDGGRDRGVNTITPGADVPLSSENPTVLTEETNSRPSDDPDVITPGEKKSGTEIISEPSQKPGRNTGKLDLQKNFRKENPQVEKFPLRNKETDLNIPISNINEANNNRVVVEKPSKDPVITTDSLVQSKTGDKPLDDPKAIPAPELPKVESTSSDTTSLNNPPVSKKKDAGKKKKNQFFFTVSGGLDVSAAGTGKLGKLKPFVGAGIGYTLKERLTIRTGFFSGEKVYSATPDQYEPPPSFWTYYPYLQNIEAYCRVYEIPLTVSYNFGLSPKHNWFVSGGVSSYLMKKETYDFYYKTSPTGPTMNREWTTRNENNHFFSVMTLSGGYQRQLGKSIFLVAEPYLKIPMTGVGFGKVKLNSTGIMISVGIKPFGKK